MNKIKSYIIAILIPLAVGGLSALLTGNSMDIYNTFEKPALAPPGIVFPIVWTVLYTLMGVSSAIVYNDQNSTNRAKNRALITYGIQLVINFIWSIIFFNLNAFLFSFILLIVLWILVFIMILQISKINKVAGLLQIPYLLWITFAGYLTLMVYILNK